MKRGTIHRQVRCQCMLCHRNLDLFLGLFSNLINNSTSFTRSFIQRVNVSLVKLLKTYRREKHDNEKEINNYFSEKYT